MVHDMNRNYRRGVAKEYRTKLKYIKKGYLCQRSAGSHSFWDLLAVHPQKKEILFIQCKPRKFSKKAKERLLKEYEWIKGKFEVRFEVI